MLKHGYYIEVVDVKNRRCHNVKVQSEEEALEKIMQYERADAHEWAMFEDGLGDYDHVFAEKWDDDTLDLVF